MSEAQAARPRWARLAAELRRLREIAGLAQDDIARAIQVSQATVLRIEQAGQGDPPGKPPAWPKVQAWAEACRAARPDMEWLRELAGDALEEHSLFRHRVPGSGGTQEEVRAEEAVTRTLRNFNPWGVPGLLQTPAYARRALILGGWHGPENIDAEVEVRLRRQEILRDRTRQFEFVLTEAGLRWRPGSGQILPGQLAHLADTASLPAVKLSVIPASAVAHAIPRCGFILFEDRDGADPYAEVELPHRELRVEKPADLDIYRGQYDLLRRAALSGDEAVGFIREVARSLA